MCAVRRSAGHAMFYDGLYNARLNEIERVKCVNGKRRSLWLIGMLTNRFECGLVIYVLDKVVNVLIC